MDINEDIEIQNLALTEKELLFCEKYAETSNGTKSAIFAGYLKYSPQEAAQILRREDVQKYIKYLRLRVAEQAGVSAVRNAKALAEIAYGNLSNLRTGWMDLKDWDELTDEEKSILSEVQTETITTYTKDGTPIITEKVKIRVHDKLRAIDSLNKMFGFNVPKKVEVTGEGGAPIQVTGMVIQAE